MVEPYPSEKYESQWEGLSHILWKIKNVPNHQPDIYMHLSTKHGISRVPHPFFLSIPPEIRLIYQAPFLLTRWKFASCTHLLALWQWRRSDTAAICRGPRHPIEEVPPEKRRDDVVVMAWMVMAWMVMTWPLGIGWSYMDGWLWFYWFYRQNESTSFSSRWKLNHQVIFNR